MMATDDDAFGVYFWTSIYMERNGQREGRQRRSLSGMQLLCSNRFEDSKQVHAIHASFLHCSAAVFNMPLKASNKVSLKSIPRRLQFNLISPRFVS